MKLFVAKLPQSATADALKTLFESYGVVTEAKVIMDKDTGKSKEYGFVEMTNAEDAQNAINGLNGFNLGGKDILVKLSDPTPKRSDDKLSPSRSDGDRRDFKSRDDRKFNSNPFNNRNRQEDPWEVKRVLRPRRKKI